MEGHLRYQSGVLQPKVAYEGAATQPVSKEPTMDVEESVYCQCNEFIIKQLHCDECSVKGECSKSQGAH